MRKRGFIAAIAFVAALAFAACDAADEVLDSGVTDEAALDAWLEQAYQDAGRRPAGWLRVE